MGTVPPTLSSPHIPTPSVPFPPSRLPLANPPKAIRAHALCVTMSMVAEHDFQSSLPHQKSLWGSILRLSLPQQALPAAKHAAKRIRLHGKGLLWPEMPVMGRKVFPNFQVDCERFKQSLRLARALVAVLWSLPDLTGPLPGLTAPTQSPPHPPRLVM